jgi:hypothetical protein
MVVMGSREGRMAIRVVLLVGGFGLAAAYLAGCSADVDLFPIQGPYSQQRPVPLVKAKADGITGNSGTLSLTLPDGQSCRGRWSSVAPQAVSVSSGSLFGTYGSLAGYAVTSGNQPGVNKGQAFATCNGGTSVDVEFFTGSGTANGYGVAKDTDGNVYKVLF